MTTPAAETATERARHAITLAHALSSAQREAVIAAFKDDEETHHLLTAAANTHLALERKLLVHAGLDTLTDLGCLVRTVLVEGAAIVLEDAERQDAGPHAIVINKQRHGEVVSVRFASPDRLDDVLFEMGVPPQYRASVRVPHDQRGTYQVRERRYTWAPATVESVPVTPTSTRQQPQRHRVADDGTRQVAKVIRTLTPPMRRAITAIAEDPIAPGVDGRTLEALLNRELIRDIPGHYFPRFALTALGRLVHETLDKRATKDDKNEDKEPEQPDAEQAAGARATGVDSVVGGARGHGADRATLPAGGAAIMFAPVPQGARWRVLVTQESSRLYRVTVDHDDLKIDHDPHDITALAEAVRARALELFAHGSARAIGGEQSVEVTSWEIKDSRRAAEAPEFHTQRPDAQSHEEHPAGTGLLHLPPQNPPASAVLALRQDRAAIRPHEGRTVVRAVPPHSPRRTLLALRPDREGRHPHRRAGGLLGLLPTRAPTPAAPVPRLRREQAGGSTHRRRATVREVRRPASAGRALPALRQDPQGRDREHRHLPGLRPASDSAPGMPQLPPNLVGDLPRRGWRTVVR